MLESKIDARPIEQKRLFEFLSEMGLLASPQGAIEYYRKNYPLYVKTDLSDDDIDGVGYYGAHFEVRPRDKIFLEIWIGDQYVHPDTITWIDVNPLMSYGVLDRRYPGDSECKIFCNPDTVFRHHKIEPNDDFKMYTTEIDVSQYPYNGFDITQAAFYITQNKFHIPGFRHKSGTIYEVKAPYRGDIDFFICSNLARVVECNMWYRQLVTSPTSNKLYCGIIIDHDDQAPIDARFYPAVLARGILRAYTIGCREYRYPLGAYLMNYPELLEVQDPYFPSKSGLPSEIYNFLVNYKAAGANDVISGDDSIPVMYDKLSRICAGCYNICEILPPNYEPSNFLICDNSNKNHPTFIQDTIDGTDVIRSTLPYQPFREILLYDRCPYTGTIDHVTLGRYDYYMLPAEYDADKFTLIKFNAAEDTHLMNANDYLVEDNLLNLHYKLNRFYRNLMVVRMHTIDHELIADEQVYVGTTPPETIDEHMWFEYILNSDPEEFETKGITIYLNRESIPEPIKKGMYSLDLPTDGGEIEYGSLMETYFKLTKYYQKHLVLHHEPGIEDPKTKVIDTIQLGNLVANPSILPTQDNELLIDSREFPHQGIRDFHYIGEEEYPDIPPAVENDLYVKMRDGEGGIDTPNDKINEIEFGNFTPEGSKQKLWIDPENPPSDKPEKDSLDSVSEQFMFGDSVDNIMLPEHGAYAIDGIIDQIMEEIDPVDEGDFYDISNMHAPAANDLLTSIINAVSEGITVDTVENPETGMYALEIISGPDMGKTEEVDLDGVLTASVRALSRETKQNIITRYITDDDAPANPSKSDWWFHYVSEAEDWELNTIVKKLILTKSLFDVVAQGYGELGIEGETLPDLEEANIELGQNEITAEKEGTMLIKAYSQNPDGSVNLNNDYAKRQAIRYIMSLRQPEDALTGDLWITLSPIHFEDIIEDVLASVIIECGNELPEEVCPGFVIMPDGTTRETTAMIDFGLHGSEQEVRTMQKVTSALHTVHYGGKPDISEMEDHGVWFEWLDEVAPAVCYSSPDTMVLRVDDHLYGVEFGPNEHVEIFAFDDVVVHFTQYERGTKYLAILADLMESKKIEPSDVAIFANRMITCRDRVDPYLRRVFGRESNVISTLRTEWDSYSIVFSMNIGRFTMDYRTAKDREQENAYKMIIDLRERDFAYLPGRMLLFVNGKYIRPEDISEPAAHLIQIKNFYEVIACVDILYYKRDRHIIKIKKLAADHWPIADKGKFVDPKLLTEMEFIEKWDKSYKGYYDVLYREYIASGYLVTRLNEIKDDPEAIEDFKRELLFKFEDITDKKLFGFTGENHIVISGENHGHAFYEIH